VQSSDKVPLRQCAFDRFVAELVVAVVANIIIV
jgi:hypothetical protein